MGERAKLRHNGISYTDEQLRKAGNNVASLWGAFCYGYKLDRKEKVVIFSCVEHDEKFVSSVLFDDLSEFC